MQPLSDGTKKFMLYAAIFLVAVCNIVFGLYSMSGPPARQAPAPGAPPVAAVVPAPGYGPMQTDGNAPAAVPNNVPSAKAAGRPNRPLAQAAGQTGGQTGGQVGAQVAGDGASAKCDVDACTAAYFTFRASDCTYMPSGGGRRVCTKGKPPQ
jgi:BA14K-like protein